MNAFAVAGAGFLLAVLWFDLMFDVQARRDSGETLPLETLTSISAYYRRVTTDAKPMGHLVGAVMLLTVGAIVGEIVSGSCAWWIGWPSLAAAVSAVSLALGRTLKNAVQLGRADEPIEGLTRRARAIFRDHLFCLAAMSLVAGLQLIASVSAPLTVVH